MPVLVIWLAISFAIRLLVMYVRLVILLRSRAKAPSAMGRPRGEGGRDVPG